MRHPPRMKITTWNVNSLRQRLTHVVDFLREHHPDVLCLQETKVTDDLFPRAALEDAGYDVQFCGEKSYNGVAILATESLGDVVKCFPGAGPTDSKRVLAAKTGDWHVLNLYVPNGQAVGTDKYAGKLDWLRQLRAFLDQRYAATDKLVVVGDFNVAL